MDRESVERLRFDRRLQNRREWIEKTDLDTHLEELPDVSQKMTTAAELEAEEETARAAAASQPAPMSETAETPAASSFGGPTTVGGGGFGGDDSSFGG